ncbi:MAG TPA: dihydroorotate dehydrogenase electron transfer subunit [Thermodesulfobacteriota bacterium]|nr:dihydroorotate dehydrogenase electron transfer subunit [Thermodesulfobacteriota bacterium]
METRINRQAHLLYNRKIRDGYFRMGVGFATPEVAPGQFVMLRVAESFDPLLRRPLGVYKVLGSRGKWAFKGTGVELLYRVVGRGTHLLSTKEPGETMDVLGPLGNGFPVINGVESTKVIMVGGGMGIVPFHLLRKVFPEALFLFGARGAVEAGLASDFKGMGRKLKITTEDGSVGTKGLVTALLKKEITKGSVIYACGPPGMLKAVAAMALREGSRCYVSLERAMACGIGVCLGCAVKTRKKEKTYKMVCSEGPVFDSTLIDWEKL